MRLQANRKEKHVFRKLKCTKVNETQFFACTAAKILVEMMKKVYYTL